jgi:gas vesicle protein
MKTSRVVLGVLAGAAVGALIGVLFAPDKGANTRRKIARKGEDIVDDVKDRLDHLKGQATEVVNKFAEKIHSAKEDMNAKAENGRTKYAQHTEK